MPKLILSIIFILFTYSIPSFAQNEGTDAYDPFADYSEFEQNTDEEADINFFRNGRFFTLGMTAGHRLFTEGMKDIYNDGLVFGLYLSYFFDLRFALQISYTTSSHPINIEYDTYTTTGDSNIRAISLNLKYFFNTQNVTKGLAALNPYIIGGFSQVTRESVVTGQDGFGKDHATGFDFGAGIEFPMLRNKMYLGFQMLYQLVTFPGEGSALEYDTGTSVVETNIYPNGDFVLTNVIIGVNF